MKRWETLQLVGPCVIAEDENRPHLIEISIEVDTDDHKWTVKRLHAPCAGRDMEAATRLGLHTCMRTLLQLRATLCRPVTALQSTYEPYARYTTILPPETWPIWSCVISTADKRRIARAYIPIADLIADRDPAADFVNTE